MVKIAEKLKNGVGMGTEKPAALLGMGFHLFTQIATILINFSMELICAKVR